MQKRYVSPIPVEMSPDYSKWDRPLKRAHMFRVTGRSFPIPCAGPGFCRECNREAL